MFARATSRLYTCVQCQFRLARRECLGIESQTLVKRELRRWQSSTAEATVENEYDEDGIEVSRDRSEGRSRRSYANRRWRPAPTAKIGVDVLGKPAEILLLPDGRRARRATERDAGEQDEEVTFGTGIADKTEDTRQPGVHESLILESKPVSIREALENIRKIRKLAESVATDGFLEREQWLKYSKALSTGFSKKQLQRYIEDEISAWETASTLTPSTGTPFTKGQTADDIMTKIWELKNDLPKESERQVTKSFNIGKGRRELIVGNDRQWRRFLHHVTVKQSTKPGWLDVSGPESWVMKAQSVFQSLRKKVRVHVLAMPPPFLNALNRRESEQGSAAHATLQDLIQQHEVTITKGAEWKAYAFSQERIAGFERDLVLCQRGLFPSPGLVSGSEILSMEELNPDTVMPVYESSFQSQSLEWYRNILPRALDDDVSQIQHTDTESAAFQELTASLKRRIQTDSHNTLGYTFPSNSITSIGHNTTDLSIDIGQAVHAQLESREELVAHDSLHSTSSKTSFMSQIPFLPQYLVQQTPQPTKDNIKIDDESLLRLSFAPSDPRSYPTILVQATATISTNTKFSNLTIKSVNLKFPSQTVYIALPRTSFDLKLKYGTTVPIFQHGLPMQEAYSPLLGHLASQVKQENEPRKQGLFTDLNTLLTLDLTCLKSTATKPKQKPSLSDDKKNIGSDEAVRYALDTADLVDTRLYQKPAPPLSPISDLDADTALLEYTSYSPLSISSNRTRTPTLKIREKDQSTDLPNKERIARLVGSAFRVVKDLDAFVLRKGEEMTRKPATVQVGESAQE